MRAPRATFVEMVCSGGEFNALRHRLPRATRRTVPRAMDGDLGVIVQAVGPDDRPLSTRYACVRADDDPRPTIERLKTRIGEAL
jgi:hypothetical protein